MSVVTLTVNVVFCFDIVHVLEFHNRQNIILFTLTFKSNFEKVFNLNNLEAYLRSNKFNNMKNVKLCNIETLKLSPIKAYFQLFE